LSLLLRSLLLHSSRHPPHLHSFPTRRSSDLPWASRRQSRVRRANRGQQRLGFHHHARTAPVGAIIDRAMRVAGVQAIRAAHARRSEEHTSELQSLAYLVCRLLLEKKKRNQKK